MGMPFSSIENVFILDHRPILLGWREKGFRKGYSFKFNRTCLEDPEFNEKITKTWNYLSSNKIHPYLMTFRDKMDAIKKVVKEWKFQKDKRAERLFMKPDRIRQRSGIHGCRSATFQVTMPDKGAPKGKN